ncbi:MAG: hypothetical protein PUG38_03600 [Sutterellaceae bacterium]|nr:hypothetical protein [Sutterellaceae bacterium]MDY2868709.1 hypothetical protein [Mesosutterella sp.]
MHSLTRRKMLSAVAAAAAAVALPGCGTSGKPRPLPEGDRVPVNAGFPGDSRDIRPQTQVNEERRTE